MFASQLLSRTYCVQTPFYACVCFCLRPSPVTCHFVSFPSVSCVLTCLPLCFSLGATDLCIYTLGFPLFCVTSSHCLTFVLVFFLKVFDYCLVISAMVLLPLCILDCLPVCLHPCVFYACPWILSLPVVWGFPPAWTAIFGSIPCLFLDF